MSLGLTSSIARFDEFHGRQEGSNGALRYPSPFFDIAHTYLPTSYKQMFRWCRYYFLTNPLINAVVYKMSEYPITPLIFDEDDNDIKKKWEEYSVKHLKLRQFQIETGLDYFTYGNAFVTVHYPFIKWLECGSCKAREKAAKASYKFRNNDFFLACSKCGVTTPAKVIDENVKNMWGIRLLRWNPEYINVEVNPATGETAYFFDIPMTLKNDILMGKRHIIETIPQVFIDSIKHQKSLRFTSDQLFHLKRPTISQKDDGWGHPLILSVLKDTYYLQILRKAQEAIAQQHIVPLRLLFPQAGSTSSDPYTTSDLGLWKKRIEGEIQRWRMDPNHIPIVPIPLGNETIGGEGKALMLHQEMQAWSEQIVAGMHVPAEFVFGGLSYSGSNVSMRMLENQFLGYRMDQVQMCQDFILGRIADYMGWPRPKFHFERFKMADDLQRTSLIFQLNQAAKVSDTSLLNEMGLDIVQEEEYKKAELDKQLTNMRTMQLAQAAIQGDVQVLAAKFQLQAQKVMAAAITPPASGGGGDPSQGGGTASAGSSPTGNGSMPGGGPAPVGGQDQQPDVGEESAPGMPTGTTAYPEDGDLAPQEGVPQEMMSPMSLNQKTPDGNYSILYLARRATTELEKMEPIQRNWELLKMRGANPQLYQQVTQLLAQSQGSQTDPLSATQSPLPEFKPPRRQKTLI